jgi:hypothetical protein
MTPEQIQEQVRAGLNAVLDERARLDAETHREQHDYVRRLIERDHRRDERMEAIKRQTIGWLVIVVLGGALAVAGNYAYDQFTRVVNKAVAHRTAEP